ncbi:MAG: chaperone modulator CbpM [Bacteroidota bacterium]|nr:chaperone modulator CbpM [Bacteroidota bacterium]
MEQDELIPVNDFCIYHNIEFSFIDSLENSGLISVTSVQESSFIHADDIRKLEKFVRLHYDLDINLEGIETINHLLEKIDEMQREIVQLKNKSIG